MKLRARIEGVGLVGPGLASWREGRAALAGAAPLGAGATVLPAADMLPATERRRAGKCVRLALAAGIEAVGASGHAARDLAAIFTSSSGDGDNLHAICDALASEDRAISPTRFHNSVHNAPLGYWGIATGSMRPADSIAAFDASFGAGLLEAMARVALDPAQPVLLVAYDAPYPEPLQAARPLPDAFACALVIGGADGDTRGPTIEVGTADEPATALDDPRLESLRAAIPAARALALLVQLARGGPARVVVDYLPGMALAVELRA